MSFAFYTILFMSLSFQIKLMKIALKRWMCVRSSIQGHSSFAALLCRVQSGAWDVLFSLRPSRCILDYMSFLLVSRWSGCCPITNRIMYAVLFFFRCLCCGHPLCTGPLFFIFSETQRHRSVQNEYLHSLIRWPLHLLLDTNKGFRKIYYSWQQDKCLSLMNCIVS